MRKLIYKPEKLYSEDINDLVEADLEKGGPGSGIKGHTTVRSKKYSWGSMRHLVNRHKGHENPVHPQHWKEMQDVHSGKKESSSYKDETGKNWSVKRHPEGGVQVSHSSIAGKFEHHVKKEDLDSKD